MPSGDNKWWIDDPEEYSSYGNYSQYIGQELVQFTRDTFPLSSKREDTYVAGLSMGGFGAVVNGLRWHETFSHIGALSPGLMLADILPGYDGEDAEDMSWAFGPGYYRGLERTLGDPALLPGSYKDYKGAIRRLKEKDADIPDIYLACGTEDFIVNRSRDFHRFLEAQGVKHTYEEGPGTHDWIFWDMYIKKFLDWLPLDENAVAGKHSGNVHDIAKKPGVSITPRKNK